MYNTTKVVAKVTQVFVNSVQNGFGHERSAIKWMVESDFVLMPYFRTVIAAYGSIGNE